MLPTRNDTGSAGGHVVAAERAAGRRSPTTDLGITRPASAAATISLNASPGSAGLWRPGLFSSSPSIRSPRASSNEPTSFWRPRSCPAASLSTPDDFNTQLTTWLARANQRTVRSLQASPTQLIERIGSRCWRCRRWHPRPGSCNRIRLAGTTTRPCLATTTPSTRRRSIGWSIVSADLERVQAAWPVGWSLTIPRVGDRAARITDPDTSPSAARLRVAFQQPRPMRSRLTGILRILPTTTPSSGSPSTRKSTPHDRPR